MKYFLILYFLFAGICTSAQPPENIFIDGEWQQLFTKPLEQYFEDYAEKKPQQNLKPYSYSNYEASFEIRDGKLYLKDITISKDSINIMDRSRSIYKELFGNSAFDCDFYDGLLVLSYGQNENITVSEDFTAGSDLQILEIRQGKVVKSKILSANKYNTLLQKQFAAYKKTEAYQKHAAFYRARREELLGENANQEANNKDKSQEDKHIENLVELFPWYFNSIIVPGF